MAFDHSQSGVRRRMHPAPECGNMSLQASGWSFKRQLTSDWRPSKICHWGKEGDAGMAKRVWLCAAAIAGLLCRAGSGGAQTVTYQKDQNGHWAVLSTEGGSASADGAWSQARKKASVAPITAGAKDPAHVTGVKPVVAVSAPAGAASPTMGGVAVAAIVPPSAAHRSAAEKASSPGSTAPAATGSYPGALSKGERLYYETRDNSTRNPLSWSVHVYKSQHRMEIYYKGRLYKTYNAVFGRSRWAGAKEWEGDMRTPEGDYLIVAKRRSQRFRWFLALNYPNAIDRARFVHLRAIGDIPRGAGEGGEIGIHGTETPLLNVGDVNWTTGCISVDNSDIRELERLLPVGTLVVINP
jgi:lipoprotein-anchoring transpeptidase ErfK/SrfK